MLYQREKFFDPKQDDLPPTGVKFFHSDLPEDVDPKTRPKAFWNMKEKTVTFWDKDGRLIHERPWQDGDLNGMMPREDITE